MRLVLALCLMLPLVASAQDEPDRVPVRVGVVGLVHTHVHWILGRPDRGDIEIVGIVEPNRDLAERYSEQHGYSMDLVFDTLEEMLDATQPEAVTVFTTIRDHRRVTEVAAARGVHVMVEKPMALDVADARAMAAATEAAGVYLLTNYETTWYASVHETQRRIEAGEVGEIRKVVIHDGHAGPVAIGINEEFLEWLIDPEENGGGAITDFGCYGANLMTWLMDGERPQTVTAVTQQIQPDLYPLVDDEATILLAYPQAQAVIQASWNWPFSRKDLEVYGQTGLLLADDASTLRVRLDEEDPETRLTLPSREAPLDDPFAYLAAVIRGEVDPAGSLSSLEVNLTVMEILDAARVSAREGRTVRLGRE
ncbi:MAG: Gfo/Idh/MocA family oxidoreductase [Bacteroidota bacterium]